MLGCLDFRPLCFSYTSVYMYTSYFSHVQPYCAFYSMTKRHEVWFQWPYRQVTQTMPWSRPLCEHHWGHIHNGVWRRWNCGLWQFGTWDCQARFRGLCMPRLVSFSPHSASASSEDEEPKRASCILRKTYGLHDGCFDLMFLSLGKNTCHPGTTSGVDVLMSAFCLKKTKAREK